MSTDPEYNALYSLLDWYFLLIHVSPPQRSFPTFAGMKTAQPQRTTSARRTTTTLRRSGSATSAQYACGRRPRCMMGRAMSRRRGVLVVGIERWFFYIGCMYMYGIGGDAVMWGLRSSGRCTFMSFVYLYDSCLCMYDIFRELSLFCHLFPLQNWCKTESLCYSIFARQ